MKYNFDKIFLTWRPSSRGSTRVIVGEIMLGEDKDITFKYVKEGVNKAKKKGFMEYPGIPVSNSLYLNPMNLFSKRLIDTSRPDSNVLLDFWGADPQRKEDSLYLLAMTQGKMHTDNFEFVANFKLESEMNFVTDIAGLSHSSFNLNKLKVGSQLDFENEVTNEVDPQAVLVSFMGEKVGYIKAGHNQIFQSENSKTLNIQVRHINNGKTMQELYVNVSNV